MVRRAGGHRQDAFLKLVKIRHAPDDPPAWLYRVVRNAAWMRPRLIAGGSGVSLPRPTSWFVEPEIDGLDAEKAVASLERLPAELRETIVARLWGGLTFEQIAGVSGCSAVVRFGVSKRE